MSFWQFSESSQLLLRRCMELPAVNNSNNNKWIQKFGSKSEKFSKNDDILDMNTVNPLNNSNGDIQNTICAPIEAMEIDEKPIFTPVRIKVEKDDFCRDIMDLEPVAHFDYIVEKCLTNSNLYLILANELPVTSIEKLCKHIYNTKNINSTFIENFYSIFFPAYLKREQNRLSLDLLVKARCYPSYHKHLIVIIVKDLDLPSNILHNYVSTLSTDEQTDFLKTLSYSDILQEAFLHHLPTIHVAYKNSQKSKELQNYILTKLNELSSNCVLDKNYGRFLLNFLQTHRDYKTNITEIENILFIHKSAFMKPCLNILNEIKKSISNQ